jgi:hypothetical protein
MTRAVDVDDLTDAEAQSVAQAVDIYRTAPTSLSFFHTVPMRDENGRLSEVRFFGDRDPQRPLAVIRVADDGALAPMEDLT